MRHFTRLAWVSGRMCFTFNISPAFLANQDQPRVAEVAGGIICGCLPVTPKFFRYSEFVLKTRLLTYLQSGSPGNTPNSSSDVPNSKSPLGKWQNPANLHSYKDNYVELNDDWGVSTVVSGGNQTSSLGPLGLKSQRADDCEDLENASPGNGIMKTVRVEASE